jgi:hypothetical protein
MATFTVNFDDGTSHTYDNVPDGVTEEQVNARAANEFSDKGITGVTAGEAPAPAVPEEHFKEPTLGEKAVGAAQTAFNVAAEHPLLTGGAALGAAKYNTIKNVVGQGLESVNANTMAKNAQALSQMEHQARQYIKAGQTVPQGLQTTIDALRNKVAGGPVPAPGAPAGPVAPGAAPTTGPAAPQAAQQAAKTAQIAATQGPAAVEGASFVENISKKFAPMAAKVAPILNNPVVQGAGRVLSSPITLGAQLMAHSPSTGPAVPSTGRLRGSEINPLTNRPWTPNEIAAYEKNYQMFDQQLPQPQLPR